MHRTPNPAVGGSSPSRPAHFIIIQELNPAMIQKLTKFFRDVNVEMSKVSWPSRNELKGQTIIVIVVSLFFAAFIFIIDHILSRLLNLIY